MKTMIISAGLSLALLLTPFVASAQKKDNAAFSDSQVVVALNLEQFRQTEMGEQLMKIAKERAQAALKDMGDNESAPRVEDLKEFLGFDPFEEIRGAVIAIDNIEEPEDNLVAIIQLGETSGNIEGLLLGLPGYESEKKGGKTIHSADLDGKRIYGTIQSSGDSKVLVIAPNAEKLEEANEHAREVRKLVGQSSSSKAPFLRLSVNEFPAEIMDEGPQAAVVKHLEAVELTAVENGENLTVTLALTVDDSEHAEQLRQMANGFKAMVNFAASQEDVEEDMKQIAKIAKGIEISADGNEITASLDVPVEMVMKFLREEMDFPF